MIEYKKRIKHFASLVFSVFFLPCIVTTATAQTPQQIAQKAFRSTVLLVMEDANGQPLSLGSGFFVRESQIATNLHVVEGAVRGYAKLVGKETKFNIEGYTAVDEKRDLIILKVAAFGTQAVSLGNSDLAQVGETVYAVGNPRGLEGTFSQGIISSIRSVGIDKLIQMTAPTSQGSSGGPVLNSKGGVIGVSFASFRDGQNLNFAIPSNDLSLLLSKPANLKPLFLTKFEGVTWVANPQRIWTGTATYTFYLKNKHRWTVKDIHCVVFFYDELQRYSGFDVVRVSGPIPAGATTDVTRNSIFDIPHLQNLDFKEWNLPDRIAFLISSVINDGKDPSEYNIIDPTANRPEGHYEVRIIDYEVLTGP